MKKREITNKELAKKIDSLTELVDKLAAATKRDFDGVNIRLDKLEQGQEDIKLRLDNVAYRFELQELERRVTLLEKKARFT
jgi:hypothetical protein